MTISTNWVIRPITITHEYLYLQHKKNIESFYKRIKENPYIKDQKAGEKNEIHYDRIPTPMEF